jgi:hypothetical protein
MRGLRSTIALLVVLGGLFAYIYFVTWKQPAGGADSEQEKVFASVEADKIEELRVRSESGDTTTLEKGSEGWTVVDPLSTRAQDSEVSGITYALASLDVTRVVDENPGSLAAFGLDAPRIEVAFKASGDEKQRRLLIGMKSPTGAGLFAKRDDEPRVFLIPAYQETTFNKSTFDLRDKTVVKFERDKVDRIVVSGADRTLELAKREGDWRLTRPIEAPADYGAAEGLVGRIQNAQMKSIVTEAAGAADLRRFGLDKPSLTATVHLGSATAALLIGGPSEEGSVYAKDASAPLVVTIENSVVDELKKSADDYRRKDLFAFRAYNAGRVEVARDGQTIAFEKVKAGDTEEDRWRRTSPNAGDPDKQKMSVFLAKLESVRATSFVEAGSTTGLDSPTMSVYARFDDDTKEERVRFRKTGDSVYAAREGEAGAATISTTEFDELTKALDEVAK